MRKITITTYYPSPYGVYKEMRAKRIAIGDEYVDHSGSHCWPDGSCPFSDIDSDADLVVEDNVGIGTPAPAEKLDVEGNVNINGNLFISKSPYVKFVQTGIGLRGCGSNRITRTQTVNIGRGYSTVVPFVMGFGLGDFYEWYTRCAEPFGCGGCPGGCRVDAPPWGGCAISVWIENFSYDPASGNITITACSFIPCVGLPPAGCIDDAYLKIGILAFRGS